MFRSSNFLLLVACCLLIISVLAGCANKTALPGANKKLPIPVLPGPQSSRITLLNTKKLPVVFFRMEGQPVVVTEVLFLPGLLGQDSAFAGIDWLTLNWLAECGPKQMRVENYRAKLEQLGATIEPILEKDGVGLRLTCLRETYPESLRLLLSTLSDPGWDSNIHQRLHSKALFKMENVQPGSRERMDSLMVRHFYSNHPYGLPILGTASSLARAGSTVCKLHYDQLADRNRARILVVGDVDMGVVMEALEGSIGQWPAKMQIDLLPPGGRDYDGLAKLHIENRSSQVGSLFAAPPPNSRDAIALQTMLQVIQTELESDICRQRNLSCDARVGYLPARQAAGFLRFTADAPTITMRYIRTVIEGFFQAPPDPRKWAAAQQRLLLNEHFVFADPLRTAEALRLTLAGNPDNAAAVLDRELFARNLQATPPEAGQRVLRRYFRDLTWVYMGDTTKINTADFLK